MSLHPAALKGKGIEAEGQNRLNFALGRDWSQNFWKSVRKM
jgi:hypothetical protein